LAITRALGDLEFKSIVIVSLISGLEQHTRNPRVLSQLEHPIHGNCQRRFVGRLLRRESGGVGSIIVLNQRDVAVVDAACHKKWQ
jgi:hypothetical protein